MAVSNAESRRGRPGRIETLPPWVTAAPAVTSGRRAADALRNPCPSGGRAAATHGSPGQCQAAPPGRRDRARADSGKASFKFQCARHPARTTRTAHRGNRQQRNDYGPDGLPQNAIPRDHPVGGRLPRHDRLAIPRPGQGDQERRAVDRPGIADRAVHPPRPIRDTFAPGKHSLTTENIPILSTLSGWKYGLHSPFKCDVYFVNTRLFTGNKWGTSNPVMLRDPDFGIVRARAFGTYDFRVVDVKTFLKEVAGTDAHFRLDEFVDAMRSRLVSAFTDALASAKVPVLDLAARYSELGEALLPILNPTLPPEVRSRARELHRREREPAARGRAGDRQALEHGRDRQPERLRQTPDGRGPREGRGRRRVGRADDAVRGRHGDGATDEWSSRRHHGAATQPAAVPPPLPTAPAPPATPELLGPIDVAKVLGVTEADVIQALGDGSLKGKKIGSAWRISRAAVDEFLKS